MTALSAFGSAKKRAFDLFPLDAKITECHLQQIIFRSTSGVIEHSIRNVQKLLEEAQEATRLMAQRQRRANTYQILHARHQNNI